MMMPACVLIISEFLKYKTEFVYKSFKDKFYTINLNPETIKTNAVVEGIDDFFDSIENDILESVVSIAKNCGVLCSIIEMYKVLEPFKDSFTKSMLYPYAIDKINKELSEKYTKAASFNYNQYLLDAQRAKSGSHIGIITNKISALIIHSLTSTYLETKKESKIRKQYIEDNSSVLFSLDKEWKLQFESYFKPDIQEKIEIFNDKITGYVCEKGGLTYKEYDNFMKNHRTNKLIYQDIMNKGNQVLKNYVNPSTINIITNNIIKILHSKEVINDDMQSKYQTPQFTDANDREYFDVLLAQLNKNPNQNEIRNNIISLLISECLSYEYCNYNTERSDSSKENERICMRDIIYFIDWYCTDVHSGKKMEMMDIVARLLKAQCYFFLGEFYQSFLNYFSVINDDNIKRAINDIDIEHLRGNEMINGLEIVNIVSNILLICEIAKVPPEKNNMILQKCIQLKKALEYNVKYDVQRSLWEDEKEASCKLNQLFKKEIGNYFYLFEEYYIRMKENRQGGLNDYLKYDETINCCEEDIHMEDYAIVNKDNNMLSFISGISELPRFIIDLNDIDLNEQKNKIELLL